MTIIILFEKQMWQYPFMFWNDSDSHKCRELEAEEEMKEMELKGTN